MNLQAPRTLWLCSIDIPRSEQQSELSFVHPLKNVAILQHQQLWEDECPALQLEEQPRTLVHHSYKRERLMSSQCPLGSLYLSGLLST